LTMKANHNNYSGNRRSRSDLYNKYGVSIAENESDANFQTITTTTTSGSVRHATTILGRQPLRGDGDAASIHSSRHDDDDDGDCDDEYSHYSSAGQPRQHAAARRPRRRRGPHGSSSFASSTSGKRHPVLLLGMFFVVSICFLMGTAVMWMKLPLDSSASSGSLFFGKVTNGRNLQSQSGSSHIRKEERNGKFQLASSSEFIANDPSFVSGRHGRDSSGDHDGSNQNHQSNDFPISHAEESLVQTVGAAANFEAGEPPLTEEQEQEIIEMYREELNRFPISIGQDDEDVDGNGHDGNNNNDNISSGWETIMHPGTEALKHLHGDSFTVKKPKRRATIAEITGLLYGKKDKFDNHQNTNGNVNIKGIGTGSLSHSSEDGYMRVPKFWDATPFRIIAEERENRSGGGRLGNRDDIPKDGGVRRYLGNYGSRLMTPAEAKSIGSRIPNTNQSRDNNNNNTNNNNDLETIFIAIASYRDWQCSFTVESAFSRAKHPERIRIGVVDQIRFGEDKSCSIPPGGTCDQNHDQATCRHRSQIDYLTIEAELSVGPVFARHLGHRLYRGEYFAVQSDAHVVFVKDWDEDIIRQWYQAHNEMAILSTYLSGVEDHIDLETGQRISKSRPIMCSSDYEGVGDAKHLRHGQQPEGVPMIHEPVLDPFWAAGFSFGRGHFVVNVPYDQHLPWIFQGEEISLGLRGFSYGYDFYSPEKSVCYHYYGRQGVPMFWENVNTYRGSGSLGMNRLNAIIGMLPARDRDKPWIRTDAVKYGLGKARDVKRFFEVFGIHVESQTVEKHLCRFVGRPMQMEFKPYMRQNGMGLDYNRITYRFVDKWKNEK